MVLDRTARKWLQNRFGEDVRFDEPMSRHTSLKVGGPAEAFVAPATLENLRLLIQWTGEAKLPFLIIGDGTNLLVKDTGIAGIVIVLTKCLNQISTIASRGSGVVVRAMAGARLHKLCAFAMAANLKGMNFAQGIPGTVGGAIMMNAGTSHGWIEDVLEGITILAPTGETQTVSKERLDFSYRKLSLKNEMAHLTPGYPVIIDGHFYLQPSDERQLQHEADEILKKRRASQPTHLPSAGCFFKNPASGKPAGELIDLAGLKGKKIGGALISPKHANFIINSGGASAGDILALMETAQAAVLNMFNIALEPEVKIVGR
ncbi:MAG: UDP-N-acetylmuramate dehydrogenase [Desulfobacterales bacterium]|nr:UDP-N-acetylmuramate dehydrogenase [Desulfobacterales bacterium]